MKFYEEIVNFLRSNAIHVGHTLITNNKKRNLSDQLYEAFLNREVIVDKEAAQLIYGVWDHKYIDLKQRFLSNVVNSILMIDWAGDRSLSKYQKTYYSLIREIAAAKILKGKTLHESAVFFARRCYKKAKEFYIFDVMEDALLILSRHYATRVKRRKEYEFYAKELERVLENRRIEHLADRYYSEMRLNEKDRKRSDQQNTDLFQDYYDDLSPFLDTCMSFRYQLITRLIQLNIDTIRCDFLGMYQHCCQAVDYYLDCTILHPSSLSVFLNQKTIACIRIGEYKEGLESVNQSLKLIDSNTVNWYPVKHNEFFIHMQSGNYIQALKVYEEVARTKRYKQIPAYMKEAWSTGEAYLHFVIELGELEEKRPAKYRVGRFLNTVPEFSKDKRVQNVPILIIQILFMLLRRHTDKAIDRIEAIEKYCSRHLRYNEAVRSNAFIKMLLEIPKNSFRKAAVVRKIERYQKKLAEVPLHQSGKNFDLELIPYERLWEYVIGNLR